ncbi:hypothetical protein J8273_2125 [Carpediemonas membranifera]|uniref:Uncharacterized protein n=1 Tax=Carpediemonas membranifera TaxID=201153 RepID=A0A8J6B8F3_9EUKA|nr:hypothetical protein J8273_2125 [Carpediemonas membranifera]|eukprot:KAG9396394.1 hypothetical protein J8273_2125 [Carpediemonas membranifera]
MDQRITAFADRLARDIDQFDFLGHDSEAVAKNVDAILARFDEIEALANFQDASDIPKVLDTLIDAIPNLEKTFSFLDALEEALRQLTAHVNFLEHKTRDAERQRKSRMARLLNRSSDGAAGPALEARPSLEGLLNMVR